MTAAQSLALASLCASASVVGVATLVLRGLSVRSPSPAPPALLPFAFRCVHGVASGISPWFAWLVRGQRGSQLSRALDSLGLSPQVTAQTWEASRAVHALLSAGAVLLLSGIDAWLLSVMAAGAGYAAGGIWVRRRRDEQERRVARELPAYLDLLTVCVEAGSTLTAGVRLIVAEAPDSPLRSYFDRVLREVRGGRPRAQAFAHVAEIYSIESLSALASALAHAESAGMSLGQVLRDQSAQRTSERFSRAEKLAMQAPVKMLGPLIFCIFPCTFIVLAVPIAVRLREAFGT
jgi:tight adherence protein C